MLSDSRIVMVNPLKSIDSRLKLIATVRLDNLIDININKQVDEK